MKKITYIVPFVILLSIALIISACKSKEEQEEFALSMEYVEGNFMITEATFLEPVDLDGDGALLPTTDARQCLYDIFDIYINCPTEDTSIFVFDSPNFYHLCGLTQESRELGSYTYENTYQILLLYLNYWNNPGGYFVEQQAIHFDIEEDNRVDGVWILQGRGEFILTVNPGEVTPFSFVLKELILD